MHTNVGVTNRFNPFSRHPTASAQSGPARIVKFLNTYLKIFLSSLIAARTSAIQIRHMRCTFRRTAPQITCHIRRTTYLLPISTYSIYLLHHQPIPTSTLPYVCTSTLQKRNSSISIFHFPFKTR